MIKISIPAQRWYSKLGDRLMIPVMYLVQFPSLERPQVTHYWNNDTYPVAAIAHLNPAEFVSVSEEVGATKRWWAILPIFHIPLLGGWKKFVVLEPKVVQDQWFVGWVAGDNIGISQIKLTDRVRLLRGPSSVFFFGINEHGDQVTLQQVGEGVLRTDHAFKNVPLL